MALVADLRRRRVAAATAAAAPAQATRDKAVAGSQDEEKDDGAEEGGNSCCTPSSLLSLPGYSATVAATATAFTFELDDEGLLCKERDNSHVEEDAEAFGRSCCCSHVHSMRALAQATAAREPSSIATV